MQHGRDAEHHRKRAEELRAAAAQMKDDPARECLLKLADEYDAMADRNAPPETDDDSGEGSDGSGEGSDDRDEGEPR